MTNKIFIGLDLYDGVINTDPRTLLHTSQEILNLFGSLESVANPSTIEGYGIVIIQPKVVLLKDKCHRRCRIVNNYMLDLLGKAGCTDIDGIYFSETSEKNDPTQTQMRACLKLHKKKLLDCVGVMGFT